MLGKFEQAKDSTSSRALSRKEVAVLLLFALMATSQASRGALIFTSTVAMLGIYLILRWSQWAVPAAIARQVVAPALLGCVIVSILQLGFNTVFADASVETVAELERSVVRARVALSFVGDIGLGTLVAGMAVALVIALLKPATKAVTRMSAFLAIARQGMFVLIAASSFTFFRYTAAGSNISDCQRSMAAHYEAIVKKDESALNASTDAEAMKRTCEAMTTQVRVLPSESRESLSRVAHGLESGLRIACAEYGRREGFEMMYWDRIFVFQQNVVTDEMKKHASAERAIVGAINGDSPDHVYVRAKDGPLLRARRPGIRSGLEMQGPQQGKLPSRVEQIEQQLRECDNAQLVLSQDQDRAARARARAEEARSALESSVSALLSSFADVSNDWASAVLDTIIEHCVTESPQGKGLADANIVPSLEHEIAYLEHSKVMQELIGVNTMVRAADPSKGEAKSHELEDLIRTADKKEWLPEFHKRLVDGVRNKPWEPPPIHELAPGWEPEPRHIEPR